MKSLAKPLPSEKFALAFFALLQERPEDEAPDEMETEAEEILEEIFKDSSELIEHFWPRFFAFLHILDHPDVHQFTSGHPGIENVRIHPALLTAAAEIKLSRNGRFPRRKLIDRAEELRKTEFADWSWDETEP